MSFTHIYINNITCDAYGMLITLEKFPSDQVLVSPKGERLSYETWDAIYIIVF